MVMRTIPLCAVLLLACCGAFADDKGTFEDGHGKFLKKDYAAAVRSLSTLAPFEQPGVGPHAQYLLARVHHLHNERPEAVAGYQAAIANWERQRGEASTPAPEFVARAYFYWGVVLTEFGDANEAMARFLAAVRANPESAVAAEAHLRAGIAGVQSRKFTEALAALAPIQDHPTYADQALRWTAKAQYGVGTTPVPRGRGATAAMMAVPDPQALADGIRTAAETYRKAEARAAAMTAGDPQAKSRRAVILLELGDALQLDRKYKEAADAYAVASAAGSTETVEHAMARRAIALQLVGQYGESDKVCLAFAAAYPNSALAAEIAVRHAENALLAAHAAGQPAYPEAIDRFKAVIATHPETLQANVARMGLGTVQYLQGQYAQAAQTLSKISESERADDLIGAAYLLADCQLRDLPVTADDALSSARLVQQLERTITQLEAYVASRPNAPDSVDALLRVGYASRRLFENLADPLEQRRALAKARRAYAQIISQSPEHPLYPVALLENAKILSQFAGAAPAVMELSKFQAEPLNKTALAPLATIQLADAQRVRRRPAEAIRLLEQVRADHEAALLNGGRAEWVPVMRYALALAYKESGKFDEARGLFRKIAEEYPKQPEGVQAVWRAAQCAIDPAMQAVEGHRKALAASQKPQTQQELLAALLEATQQLRAAAEQMGSQAATLVAAGDESDVPLKMNYDAAWGFRVVGEVEAEVARRTNQPDAAPTISPGEKMAREKFKAVIDLGGESPLVDEARLELADLYAAHDETDAAIDLLRAAIAKDTDSDIADPLKLRLGMLYLAKNDAKSAHELASQLTTSQRGPYVAYARALAAEALHRQKDWPGVIEAARIFLDGPKGPGRIPGVGDVAVLRMADAQAQSGQWNDARHTLDQWLARFPGSPHVYDAKFAYAQACEKLAEPDRAVAVYAEVAARCGGDIAAKATAALERLRPALKPAVDAPSPKAPNPKRRPPLVTPPPLVLRLPNVLSSPRKGVAISNPVLQPAAAVATPPVNNLEGTAAFGPLKPIVRSMPIEIIPPAAPLPFDQAPYVQAPQAAD